MPTFANDERAWHSHDFPHACVVNLSAKWFEQLGRVQGKERPRSLFNNSLEYDTVEERLEI